MPPTVEDVGMIKARAALAYFTHWQELHWKGTGRKPIPPEWHRVGLRKGLFGTANRHATGLTRHITGYSKRRRDFAETDCEAFSEVFRRVAG